MKQHTLLLLLLFQISFLSIYGFTISVPVLILPVFRQLLLRYGRILSKLCFETSEHSVQAADDNSIIMVLLWYYGIIMVLLWYYIVLYWYYYGTMIIFQLIYYQ